MSIIIKSNKVSIREIRKEDYSFFYSLYNNEINMKYISSGKYCWTENEINNKLLEHIQLNRKGYGIFALQELNTNSLIGEVGLFDSFKNEKSLELGYIIDSKFWNQGFGYEACKLLIEYAFDKLNVNNLVARMYKENIASIRIVEKCNLKIKNSNYSETGKEYFTYEIKRNFKADNRDGIES